ncbi:hypothetical protein Ahy_A07g037229 [Arachis hypogaea]|uniref:Pathogen-related protein n=1 Tax=Arachis hypogaea TaxID=3818 RepID=A0A445CI42_ARAHY|nr:hypothetical protein Ahy_A07g037229 [Arachis hypogaea]
MAEKGGDSGSEVEKAVVYGDKYRTILEDEVHNTHWRHGGPPLFDAVNKLFEQGRTKEWPKGSLEETVQNAVKLWEMELSHKTRLQDFRSINPDKFMLSVNGFDVVMREKGRKGLNGEETLRLGSYNALLKNTLPEQFQFYKASEETYESSHEAFRTAMPRGFAWEVIKVYSGPPLVTYKFRHWGFFEGPFRGHAPTGEMVEFFGIGVMKINNSTEGNNNIRGVFALNLILPPQYANLALRNVFLSVFLLKGKAASASRFGFESLPLGLPRIAVAASRASFFWLTKLLSENEKYLIRPDHYIRVFLQVDETLRAEEVEIYYDPSDIFGVLLKGHPQDDNKAMQHLHQDSKHTHSCPFAN